MLRPPAHEPLTAIGLLVRGPDGSERWGSVQPSAQGRAGVPWFFHTGERLLGVLSSGDIGGDGAGHGGDGAAASGLDALVCSVGPGESKAICERDPRGQVRPGELLRLGASSSSSSEGGPVLFYLCQVAVVPKGGQEGDVIGGTGFQLAGPLQEE